MHYDYNNIEQILANVYDYISLFFSLYIFISFGILYRLKIDQWSAD